MAGSFIDLWKVPGISEEGFEGPEGQTWWPQLP